LFETCCLLLIAYRVRQIDFGLSRYAICDLLTSLQGVAESVDLSGKGIAPFVHFCLLFRRNVLAVKRQKRTRNNLESFSNSQDKPMVEERIGLKSRAFGDEQRDSIRGSAPLIDGCVFIVYGNLR